MAKAAMIGSKTNPKKPKKAMSGAKIKKQKGEAHLPMVEHSLKGAWAPPEAGNTISKKNAPKRKAKQAGKKSK